MKVTELWAVFDKDGEIKVDTIKKTEVLATSAFLRWPRIKAWDYYKSVGYYVSKIKVEQIQHEETKTQDQGNRPNPEGTGGAGVRDNVPQALQDQGAKRGQHRDLRIA